MPVAIAQPLRATLTATSTATAMPTSTPTITASAIPTNSPECELAIKQNLQARLPAPNTGMVTNRSASRIYPVGLAILTGRKLSIPRVW
jgi:hypothetical protein